MKVVRVYNPSGLMATKKRKVKTMAKRKRKAAATGTRRRTTRKRTATVNPRRRRHRRRSNPGIVRRRTRRTVAVNPRRWRHHRRRNPSAAGIGQIFKNMVYGAGGAILTRVGEGLVSGFIPASLAGSSFAKPVVQAIIAVIPVRMAGTKFLGKPQGDIMMLGGLISAGLAAADAFLPNIQGQLTSIVRAPVQIAPVVPQALAGFRDVEDVNYQAEGFGHFADVEDVDTGMFNNY